MIFVDAEKAARLFGYKNARTFQRLYVETGILKAHTFTSSKGFFGGRERTKFLVVDIENLIRSRRRAVRSRESYLD